MSFLFLDAPLTHIGGKKKMSQHIMLGNTDDVSLDAFMWIRQWGASKC
jgi:hypothetical protein